MEWPEFNELGDLPIGLHQAKIGDVLAHFGVGTAWSGWLSVRV
jgi:hypothetical protein